MINDVKKEGAKLIQPSLDLLDALQVYQETFDNPGHIAGSGSITTFPTIEDWLIAMKLYENEETLPNEGRVPSRQYVFVQEKPQKIIGMLSLRIRLNDYLLNYGGHIGYSIAPDERKQGYGSLMLNEALKEAKTFGLNRVLITCDDDNLASARVIEKNQGILEDRRFNDENQKWIRRYWIKID